MSGRPCADCFRGGVHEGNPVGTETTIHNLPVYVSSPPEGITPRGIVVYIPDAFGWKFGNNRLLADKYAKRAEVLVYLPDFMNGHPIPLPLIDISEKLSAPSSWLTTLLYKPLWILRLATMVVPFLFLNRPSVVKPRVFNFFQALRTSPPPFPTNNLKIAAAGFCWGGKHTVLLAQDTPSSRVVPYSPPGEVALPLSPLIDCAFTAHPSMLSVPGDINEITVPISIAVGEADMALGKKEVLTVKEILEVKKKGDHEVVIIDGAKHGFAVRTMDDKFQWECAAKAETQAVEWFKRWFA